MEYKYIIRNYRPEDFTTFARLNLDFSKLDSAGCIDSPEALTHMLNRPGYLADKDLFIAEVGGEVVGYASVILEPGIRRVIIDCLVRPDYRAGPVPEELISHAMQRGKELKAKVAHMNISAADQAVAELLTDLGFNIVRCFHELRIDLSMTVLEANGQFDSVCCCMKSGEEEQLIQIQNRCFTGTWGYDPDAARHLTWWLQFRRNSLNDIILTWEENRVTGFCWTGTICGSDLTTGRSKGRIYMLGVDPECRRRDVGKNLLLAGLSYLKSEGREIADITVDSQNIVAVNLYRSVGFEPLENTLWYEKVIV
jgi:mycothiol synthase